MANTNCVQGQDQSWGLVMNLRIGAEGTAGCSHSHYRNSQTCDARTHLCRHHIRGGWAGGQGLLRKASLREIQSPAKRVPKKPDVSAAAAEGGQAAGPGEEGHLSTVGRCVQGSGVGADAISWSRAEVPGKVGGKSQRSMEGTARQVQKAAKGGQ